MKASYNGVFDFKLKFGSRGWGTEGGDRAEGVGGGGYGGRQKAHTKLRVPMHSPSLPRLPTPISNKWGGGELVRRG